MTKDVELHSSTWKSMKQAITGLTENVTVSSSGYGNYTNAQAGPYSTGTTSTGFAKRVEDLVKISEKVQQMIKERDTDGAVSYSYHDETSTAQTLQSKLSTLERYAENVNNYIKNKIDQPFYEAMDKVGAKLEALSIQQYKTTNKVGYKRTDVLKDEYGNPIGTMQVTPDEIGIDELYKVDSPYKATLQKSYEEFKKSKDYKDHKLTQDQYLMAMHHTRSFEYVSIDDEKANIEMWRDIALGVGVVVLTIFCPPAGAVAGVVVASADMYSAVSGKDWGTGRELDNTERGMRGAFALLDLIPAAKYLSSLIKTGKTAGLTAVKTSLKTAIKEGVEQGVKNLDNFKGLLKNVKGLGDNVLSHIKNYGKQLDNLRPSKILSNSAEALSDSLRHADNVISEAAQNFRMNIGLEPKLADGVLSSGGGKLTHLADNLSAFAKNLDGSVDDVMELGGKSGSRFGGSQTKHWLEDAGEILTDGSHMDGKVLKPNVVYEAGEHRYLYRTDEVGRIDRAYAEDLQLKLHEGRLPHNSNTPDKEIGDHAGHIFGDLFGGSPELDNLVSQAKDVNLKEYRRIERDWADALKSNPPKKVEVDIKINYDGSSMRPTSFEVVYSIDGEVRTEIIKNVNK
ncbi:DNA/RNA non-specific endonuclease [Streptococcus infantis]|uniref:DNA/RNA non-specific endonuclease n=1 Tax=Streptococcus infantis TaxID=68892 RepID=UPI0039C2CE89